MCHSVFQRSSILGVGLTLSQTKMVSTLGPPNFQEKGKGKGKGYKNREEQQCGAA